MTMNEHQVENQLSQHGDEILARRQPKVVKRRVALKPILVTGTAVVATATFLLLPMNAEAAKIAKIKNAMKHVQSMEQRGYSRVNGGPWRQYYTGAIQRDRSRIEVMKGAGQKATYIEDHETTLRSYGRLPFALLVPRSSIENKESDEAYSNPLKAEIDFLQGSGNPSDYTYSSSKGDIVNGQRTYVINVARADTKQSIKVVVNEATDLPIEVFEHDEPVPGTNRVQSDFHKVFEYNKKYDPDYFSLGTEKTVIDVAIEEEKLRKKWAEVAVTKDHAPIYASSVTSDGSIMIAYGVKDTDQMGIVPSEVVAAGAKYALSTEFQLGGFSNSEGFLIHGLQVIVATFVPIYDPVELPSRIQVRFGTRPPLKDGQPSFGKVDQIIDTIKPESFEAETEQYLCPMYMAVLGQDKYFLVCPAYRWKTKGEAREKLGDIRGAAVAFERAGDAWKNFVEYMGYKPYREAARCYDLLGDQDKANKLREHAAELERTRVR